MKLSLISEVALDNLLLRIGEVRAHLRYAHLVAHLRSASLLSVEQINRYNTLRGYAHVNPGVQIARDDEKLPRQHNNCD